MTVGIRFYIAPLIVISLQFIISCVNALSSMHNPFPLHYVTPTLQYDILLKFVFFFNVFLFLFRTVNYGLITSVLQFNPEENQKEQTPTM